MSGIIINKYTNENNELITEYIKESQVVAKFVQLQSEPSIKIEVQPTIEQQILAELQYNTALTEMKMLGGM